MKKDVRKCRVIKPPVGVNFTDGARAPGSIYYNKLTEAINSDCAIEVLTADKYTQHQLRTQAKKMSIKLVFGQLGENFYIKPIRHTEAERKLMLLLREARSLEYLRSQSLELDLAGTLNRFAAAKLATPLGSGGHWKLTQQGLEFLNTQKNLNDPSR